MNITPLRPSSPCAQKTLLALLPALFVGVFVGGPSLAWAGHVTWFCEESGGLFFKQREKMDSPEAAIKALLDGPTDAERAQGVVSAIPMGVSLLDLEVMDDGVVVDLSEEAAHGLDDVRSEQIFRQFLYTMSQFELDTRVDVLVEGRSLSEYLPPAPPAIYLADPDAPYRDLDDDKGPSPFTMGLNNKRITLSEGHGYTYTGSQWTTQRGIVCDNPQEDFRNLKLARYLRVFFENDGAYVQHTREHDLGRGSGPSSHSWWQQAAYVYLRDQGYACNVYASLSGTCSFTGANHRNDDIRSRPLASNLDSRGNTDIYLSVHTNAFEGNCYASSCPSGTGTYYTEETENAAYSAAGRTLAGHITLAVVAAANEAEETRGDGADWRCHGTCAPKKANFGETRVARRPAALLELGFHDSCNTDAAVMDRPFFQSVTMWGMYKGTCDYFGTTPSWPLYAAELVSATIPNRMVAGQSVEVEITYRNKSVLWDRDYGFKLAAEGDADPFAATRHELGAGVVDNNGPHTFRFPFTAPASLGNHQTSWRMIREGHRRFGEQLTRTVEVLDPNIFCIPGQTETGPCGHCGARIRVCGETLEWEPWGDCEEGGECEPGETDERQCGDCAVQTRHCGEDCLWQEYGPCQEEGVDGDICETGLAGPCSFGLWTCADGQMECVAQVTPQQERCDGIDNSCNGLIDDGFPSELGDPPPAFAAELVHLSHPPTLYQGQEATVNVVFRNVGALSWATGEVVLVHLPPDRADTPILGGPWSQSNSAATVSYYVAPGEEVDLRFQIVAPMFAGSVMGVFQLMSPDGVLMRCPRPAIWVDLEVVEGQAPVTPGDGGAGNGNDVKNTGGCGCHMGLATGMGWPGSLWLFSLLLSLWLCFPPALKKRFF